jgi:integrase-like protein
MTTWRDVVMVGLLCYAGLRPEEMYALRWADVGEHVLTIDRALTAGELKGAKTGQRRTVEIVPPLASDLARVCREATAPEALVAASETGGFLNTNNRVWTPACRRAGVEATPYDGRHTYASLLIHEGRQPLLVSAALGHASGELVWRRYAHVFDAARYAQGVPMVAAIEAARESLSRAGLRPGCDEDASGVVRLEERRAQKAALSGENAESGRRGSNPRPTAWEAVAVAGLGGTGRYENGLLKRFNRVGGPSPSPRGPTVSCTRCVPGTGFPLAA